MVGLNSVKLVSQLKCRVKIGIRIFVYFLNAMDLTPTLLGLSRYINGIGFNLQW